MSDVAGSIVSGAMGALGTWINNVYEDRRAREQRDWNEQMMQNQNAWNYQMWQEQNAYNTPAAQRQRMEEAGFNPVLAKGEPGLAQQLTSEDVNPYERAHLQNPIIEGMNAALMQAQVSKTQNEAVKVAEETETEKKRREEMDARIKDLIASARERASNFDVNSAEYQKLMKEIDWYERIQQANINYQASATKLNKSQSREIDSLLPDKQWLLKANKDEIDKRIEKMNAEIDKILSETDLNQMEMDNYILVHGSSGFLGTGVSVQNLDYYFDRLLEAIAERRKRIPKKPAGSAKGGGSR